MLIPFLFSTNHMEILKIVFSKLIKHSKYHSPKKKNMELIFVKPHVDHVTLIYIFMIIMNILKGQHGVNFLQK